MITFYCHITLELISWIHSKHVGTADKLKLHKAECQTTFEQTSCLFKFVYKKIKTITLGYYILKIDIKLNERMLNNGAMNVCFAWR